MDSCVERSFPASGFPHVLNETKPLHPAGQVRDRDCTELKHIPFCL
jgi:hypothetical protein